MAGVGLGNLYVNMFSQSICCGLNGAIATFVSQAFGSENHRLCGIYLNRGRYVAFLAFLPMIVMLMMCEKVLVAIN